VRSLELWLQQPRAPTRALASPHRTPSPSSHSPGRRYVVVNSRQSGLCCEAAHTFSIFVLALSFGGPKRTFRGSQSEVLYCERDAKFFALFAPSFAVVSHRFLHDIWQTQSFVSEFLLIPGSPVFLFSELDVSEIARI